MHRPDTGNGCIDRQITCTLAGKGVLFFQIEYLVSFSFLLPRKKSNSLDSLLANMLFGGKRTLTAYLAGQTNLSLLV